MEASQLCPPSPPIQRVNSLRAGTPALISLWRMLQNLNAPTREVEYKNQSCRSAKMGSPWQAGPVHSSGGLRRDRNCRDTPKRCGTATGGPHTAALSGSQAVPIACSFIHPLRGHISRVMFQEQEGRRWSLPSRDPQSSRRQGTRQFPQPRAPPVYRVIRSCRAFWKRGGKLVHIRSTG